jgi:hypothetical protein
LIAIRAPEYFADQYRISSAALGMVECVTIRIGASALWFCLEPGGDANCEPGCDHAQDLSQL